MCVKLVLMHWCSDMGNYVINMHVMMVIFDAQ